MSKFLNMGYCMLKKYHFNTLDIKDISVKFSYQYRGSVCSVGMACMQIVGLRVVSRAELFGSGSGLKLTKISGLIRA